MASTLTFSITRVLNPEMAQKIMSADDAAALIQSGDQVGMSGFTGSGYPKAVPIALARRIADANFRGQKFQVSVFTGASTGPELDGALAMAGGIHLRLPYQSDPETRKRIKPARWTTWTFTSAMSPSLLNTDSSASSMSPSSKSPPYWRTGGWFRAPQSATTRPGSIRPTA